MATVMLMLGVAATWPIWCEIAAAARYRDQAHILLVPFVAGYLLFVRRARWLRCRRKALWIGVAIVPIGIAAIAAAPVLQFECLTHLGAVLVVIGCVVSVLGRQVLQRFFPVFAVLIFLVPIPGTVRHTIAAPIHDISNFLMVGLLRILGIAAVEEQNHIVIHGNAVTMSEVAHGTIMLFTVVLVAYAIAFGAPVRNRWRVLILAMSPLLALLLNALRAIPTACYYRYAAPTWASFIHDLSGWLIVALSFAALYGAMRALRRSIAPAAHYALVAD